MSLYMTAYVRNVELKRAVIDPGSSPNIMRLSTLTEVGIPWDHIIEQLIEVSGSGGSASFTIDYI